jgi:calcium-dependent protein kinase
MKISADISKLVIQKRGAILERYVELEKLGNGAYGVVKKVKDKSNNEIRAMKIVKKSSFSEIETSALISEIDLLKTLDHPNILKIFEFYHDDSNYFVVTELCSGGELFDRITSYKHFSERMAADIMKQLLSAVVYCHNKRIVHR